MENLKRSKFYKALGTAVIEFRHKRNLTQMELCKKAHISRTSLSSIECASHMTSLQVVLDVAEALEIPPRRLFERICDIYEYM